MSVNPITLGTEPIMDDKEASVIARRRQLEEERKGRILNAKLRTSGIDRDALDAQVNMKAQMAEMEIQRDRMYDHYMNQTAKQLSLMDAQVEREKRAVAEEVNHFRNEYQKVDTRKEYDLNDPLSLRKDLPARIGDDDPRNGVASLQKFGGEDLGAKDRIAAQAAQLREWSAQQVEEKIAKKKAEEAAERMYQARQQEINARRREAESAEEEARRNMNVAVRDYNLALSQAKKENSQSEQYNNVQDNLEEIRNNLESDLLNENPDKSISAFGSHRVVTTEWKGMNRDQLNHISNIQQAQIQEMGAARQRAAEEEKMWLAQQQAVSKQLLRKEREVERQRRQLAKDLAAQHQAQAVEKKNRYDDLYKNVYTNPPSKEYFDQFNTTSR